MKGMRARLGVLAFATLAIVSIAQGCGAENSIVDGDCASGYLLCDGRCVAANDPQHCGSCSNACPPGVGCSAGICGGPLHGSDGALEDGADEGGSGSDASQGDGSGSDGPLSDGTAPDGTAPDGSGDACPPPPYTTPSACGACGIVCTAPNGRCGPDGLGGHTCQPACILPEIECEGDCVDAQNDPANCGACGKVCASNLCIGGLCQGATPGDVVVVGHDYRFGTTGSSQAKLLTNAVLLPTSNPVRVLSYEADADANAVKNVKAILAANAAGRALSFTVSNNGADLAATNLTTSYDVVLVYDQGKATAGNLAALGTASASALGTFLKAGGVVVVLDGAEGHGGMPNFTTSAGLLDVAGHTSIPNGSQVQVVAPADAIGSGVASPYGAFSRSATLQPNEANGGNVVYVAKRVVGGVLGDPIVVHKVVP